MKRRALYRFCVISVVLSMLFCALVIPVGADDKETSDPGIAVSITLRSYAELNVYLPVDMLASTLEMSLRVSVGGLLYSMKYTDGSRVTEGGVEYLKFTYPYVFAGRMNEYSKVELIRDGVSSVYEFTVKDVILRSFSLIEDSHVRSAAAAYIDYALMASYDSEIPEEISPYIENSAEGSNLSALSKLVRTLFFDPEDNCLRLYTNESITAVFVYGGEEMSEKSVDGVLSIPLHRLDVTEDILLVAENSEVSCALTHLYGLVKNSPSRSSELLGKYITYLNTVY